jgi:hypothetical protein
MAVGYRSVLHLNEREDAIRTAQEQFRSWLVEMVHDRRKSITSADWDGPGIYRLGPESVLSVVEHRGEDRQVRLLLDYVDTNRDGTWTTRLYATSAPGSRRLKQVLWFEGEGERRDGSPVQPGTPRVVRNTLQAVDAYDGSVPVMSEPRRMRLGDVEELVGFIEDEQRDLSIVVAAPVPGVPLDRWAEAVTTLTRDAIGCASFFVLAPDAAEALNARLGVTHSIPTGAVRTFVPRVEVGDWADARRHRILTAGTMSRGLATGPDGPRFSERLIRAVAATPRLHLLEASMPTELTRTVRILQREQLRLKSTVAVDLTIDDGPAPRLDLPSTDAVEVAEQADSGLAPAWQNRLQSLVTKILGHDRVDQKSLSDLAAKFDFQEAIAAAAAGEAQRLQNERERLEDQIGDLRRQLETEQFERALADVERREAEKKTRSLKRWRDQREDRYTYVEDQGSTWDIDPANVVEIIERLTDPVNFGPVLQYVELVDIERAIDLADEVDAVDSNGTYAAAFWEYVLVLHDYMEESMEHEFSGNVHMYLNSPQVAGRKCPTQRHRPNESETVQTNAKMRRERTFRVPTSVDPSGEMFMSAHFAPTHRDQNAPRMYYYADVTRTGKVYIGYIGVHLTNTRTN